MEDLCKVCRSAVPPGSGNADLVDWVGCDDCKGCYHVTCIGQTASWLEGLGDAAYFCTPCLTARERESEDEGSQENLPSNPKEPSEVEVPQPLSQRDDNPRPSTSAAANVVRQNIAKGHDIVAKITGHDFSRSKDGRQFEVLCEDGIKLWHFESTCGIAWARWTPTVPKTGLPEASSSQLQRWAPPLRSCKIQPIG
jgi:hypothetical protein